jgi:hypothetical protein
MKAKEALLSIEEIVKNFGDHKAISIYYLEFNRRLEVLRLAEEYCRHGSTVFGSWCTAFHSFLRS